MDDPAVRAARSAFSEYFQDKHENKDSVASHIAMAMQSSNPEFLVELGEALATGIGIPRDLRLARECFGRARNFSKLMGSYALGRFYFESDPSAAKIFLSEARSLGHIPSIVLINTLIWATSSRPKWLLHLKGKARMLGPVIKGSKALLGKEVEGRMAFWRYQDDMTPNAQLDAKLGADRTLYFPWSKPVSVKVFCYLCSRDDKTR